MGQHKHSEHSESCVICDKKLLRLTSHQKMVCAVCGGIFDTIQACEKGHFVCTGCFNLSALELIEQFCLSSPSEDPIQIAMTLMRNPRIEINSPVHHYLVTAAMLTCYYNKRKEYEIKKTKLHLAKDRARRLTEGFCNQYGICGAALGNSLFLNMVLPDTELAAEEWKLANLLTSTTLNAIAYQGIPRCCKRNLFLSIINAVEFMRDYLKVIITHGGVDCVFSAMNPYCQKNNCPFYSHPKGTDKLYE
ncbi:MAG: SAM-dependent methyltransferase [Brevinematales bacterium]|nr:SAM-dependent methyltransferase [Brevinematales bacterium]